MKGTPETPQCGFSRASIQILGMQGVDPEKFTAFNVLEDQELRAGMSRLFARVDGVRNATRGCAMCMCLPEL
jgi:glutaredoxin-related protein